MMTGEYFLSAKARDMQKKDKKREQKEQRKETKAVERNLTLEAPEEDEPAHKYVNKKPSSVDDLKQKFLKKK
jgi:hypothetical protein